MPTSISWGFAFSQFCCLHSSSLTALRSHICSQTNTVFAAGPKVASIIQFFIYWWFCLTAPWGVAPADKRNCHNVEGINPSAPCWHTDRVMICCWRIICFSCKSYWSVVSNLPSTLLWMINVLKWLPKTNTLLVLAHLSPVKLNQVSSCSTHRAVKNPELMQWQFTFQEDAF